MLVDYFVELNDLNEKLSTGELKKMFNGALSEASNKPHTNREAKASDLKENRLTFGTFEVDPEYTDFVSKYPIFVLRLHGVLFIFPSILHCLHKQ